MFCRELAAPFSTWRTGLYSCHVATNARDIGALTVMVGAQIRTERFSREMGQDQLAAMAELAVSTVSRMERGRVAIDLEQCERIALAFGILPEELINRARRSAAAAAATLYRPDGSLNPDRIRTVPASDDEVSTAVEAQCADEGAETDG